MIYYFFDDCRLYMRTHTRRVYGKPKYCGEYDRGTTTGAPPNIIKGSSIAPYIMYSHRKAKVSASHDVMALCLSVSDDCIHWKEYPTDTCFENRKFPNQILEIGEYECLKALYTPDTEYKYRLIVFHYEWGGEYKTEMKMWVSSDGVHFTSKPCNLTPYPTEPFCGYFYNDLKQTHTFIIRPDWGERRCAIVETKDFETFTEPRLLMQTDSEDPPMAEMYGITACRTQDLFVGMCDIFTTGYEHEHRFNHKLRKGHLDVQLVYSYDGVCFQRSLRRPFIDRGLPSECDWYGMIFGYCITEREEDYVITAITSKREHGYFINDDTLKISSFTLRRGRFCGLESLGGDATVRMRATIYKGGPISVNIEVPYGEARSRLIDPEKKPIKGFDFDDCEPFTGDSLAWQPKWKGDLQALKGSLFAIEIKWYNGVLWSVGGNLDIVMTFPACARYLGYGKEPRKPIY